MSELYLPVNFYEYLRFISSFIYSGIPPWLKFNEKEQKSYLDLNAKVYNKDIPINISRLGFTNDVFVNLKNKTFLLSATCAAYIAYFILKGIKS